MSRSNTTLVASFEALASTVADWQEARASGEGVKVGTDAPSDPSESTVVCYFDGDFGPPGGPEPPPSDRGDYNRMVLVVDAAGRATLDTLGWKQLVPIVAP